jgi:hypothetical protein
MSTVEHNQHFMLGRQVVYALPDPSRCLRPSKEALAAAAKKLGITQAAARRALTCFNDT